MNGPGSAILVHLPDGDVGNHAGDGDVHLRLLQRQLVDAGIACLDEEEGRERLVFRGAFTLRRGVERHEQRTESDNDERCGE